MSKSESMVRISADERFAFRSHSFRRGSLSPTMGVECIGDLDRRYTDCDENFAVRKVSSEPFRSAPDDSIVGICWISDYTLTTDVRGLAFPLKSKRGYLCQERDCTSP